MSELLSQRDYWNSRAPQWQNYDVPLIPSPEDLDFMERHLVAGGDTLVLGATPELCSLALEVSGSVTATDFAEDVIEALRIDGVDYTTSDWNEFLEQGSSRYDNVMTDGGLLCLDLTASWERIARNIRTNLRPNGVFAARVYISTDQTPKDNYDNPNLNRFISSMANIGEDFMLRPGHPDYEAYDVRYALPPEEEVLRIFGQLALIDRQVPTYEAGEHFVSFAWQRT